MCAGPCSPPAVPWKWQGLCFSSLQDQVKSITIYYSYASVVTSVKAPISSEEREEKRNLRLTLAPPPKIEEMSDLVFKKNRPWQANWCLKHCIAGAPNNLTMIPKLRQNYISGVFHGAKPTYSTHLALIWWKIKSTFCRWIQPHLDWAIFTKITCTGFKL